MVKGMEDIKDYLVRIRREIHVHPEIEFDLVNTCSIVKRELEKLGLFVDESYGKSSIVCIIKGEISGNTIGLRADMDALPLTEDNGVTYKSKQNGFMHACGHDGHIAMLLGAAKILSANRTILKGSVKLIFQASEEGPGSGARLMVEDGVVDDVDNIIALHLTTEFPTGSIYANIGRSMAGASNFDIHITGKGGHAGNPHKALDAISLGVKVINNIQYILSREIDPFEPVVLNIGKVTGGSASNIIAETMSISGTIRTYSLDVQETIKHKMKNVMEGIVTLNGGKYSLEFNDGLPPLFNNELIVREASKSIIKVLGKDNFKILEKGKMGSEDFVYFLQKTKGCILWIGARNEDKGYVYPLHNAKFDFDEEALKIGSEVFAQYAIDQLS